MIPRTLSEQYCLKEAQRFFYLFFLKQKIALHAVTESDKQERYEKTRRVRKLMLSIFYYWILHEYWWFTALRCMLLFTLSHRVFFLFVFEKHCFSFAGFSRLERRTYAVKRSHLGHLEITGNHTTKLNHHAPTSQHVVTARKPKLQKKKTKPTLTER